MDPALAYDAKRETNKQNTENIITEINGRLQNIINGVAAVAKDNWASADRITDSGLLD